jgi:hypothetical protein
MKIYNYHSESFQYLSDSKADESPLEPGVFLFPANSTTIEPLSDKEKHTIHFNPDNNTWYYKQVVEEVQEEFKPTYDTLRRLEYPSVGDQLDALFKAGLFPEDLAAQIQAVKDKYPKTE